MPRAKRRKEHTSSGRREPALRAHYTHRPVTAVSCRNDLPLAARGVCGTQAARLKGTIFFIEGCRWGDGWQLRSSEPDDDGAWTTDAKSEMRELDQEGQTSAGQWAWRQPETVSQTPCSGHRASVCWPAWRRSVDNKRRRTETAPCLLSHTVSGVHKSEFMQAVPRLPTLQDEGSKERKEKAEARRRVSSRLAKEQTLVAPSVVRRLLLLLGTFPRHWDL